MTDPQKYLYFTDYDKGKVVGTHDGCNKGNGFSGEEVKDVFIPETFENVKVTEVGYCSFYGTSIESVFISRYVKLINSFAFCFCSSLEYITFDPRSELTTLELQSLMSNKIASINLPASFKEIGGSNHNSSPFYSHSYLKCVSYMGSNDISFPNLFYQMSNTPVVHSLSNYQHTIGNIDPQKDDMKCTEKYFALPIQHKKKITKNMLCTNQRLHDIAIVIVLLNNN